MDTLQKPATDKLLIRYDNALKKLLIADLKVLRERCQLISNNQAAAQQAA